MTTKILDQAQATAAYKAILAAQTPDLSAEDAIQIVGDGYVVKYNMLLGVWVKSESGSVEVFLTPEEFSHAYNLS